MAIRFKLNRKAQRTLGLKSVGGKLVTDTSYVGSRKGSVDGHCGKEKAAAGKAGPPCGTWGAGIYVLHRDALLHTSKRLEDGIPMEVLHAARILDKGEDRDVGA